MYIWSQDETGFVNSDNITSLFAVQSEIGYVYEVMADGIFLSAYETQEEAKEELRKLQTAMEIGQESYRLG